MAFGEPTVAETGGAVDRDLGAAADPHLEWLGGDRRDARVADPDVAVPARHSFAGEQTAHDVEALLEPRRCARSSVAHPAELLGPATDRGLQDEAAVGDRRQRAELLGEQHRVPQRQQEQDPARFVAPLREQPAEDRDVLVVRARAGGVVVADEQRCRARPRAPPRARSIIHRAPVRGIGAVAAAE